MPPLVRPIGGPSNAPSCAPKRNERPPKGPPKTWSLFVLPSLAGFDIFGLSEGAKEDSTGIDKAARYVAGIVEKEKASTPEGEPAPPPEGEQREWRRSHLLPTC